VGAIDFNTKRKKFRIAVVLLGKSHYETRYNGGLRRWTGGMTTLRLLGLEMFAGYMID
jgi:hypothetical protein